MFSSLAAALRRLSVVVLYTSVALTANPAAALDVPALEALREGDMRKLNFHSTPRAALASDLLDADDRPRSLTAWQGQWVVLNFWATWCAPCRHEMPSLDRLQEAMDTQGVIVLPVATGRNPLPAIIRFYDETGLSNLPILRDPQQRLARDMAVLGLPVTVILDPQGREVARLTGDADWDSASAIAILLALAGSGAD